jgi:lipoyl-dependent peroxiredoxin
MNILYTARAKAVAGRAGNVASDDGLLALDLAMPTSLGGTGKGTNPEQLFAAGYSACFHSALLFIAGQKKIAVDNSSVEATVSIGQDDGQAVFKLAASLTVSLPSLDQAAASALVEEAHAVCPYSNATRGNIPVELIVHAAGNE